MKGYSSSCINVCVIGEFISTINLANFLDNQNGIKLTHFDIEDELNFSWLIDLEKQVYQSDILILACEDVNLNCTIILTAFKNNTPVILFDEQTYFFAGDYLSSKGSLILASDTISASIGGFLSRQTVINNPVVMGFSLPETIYNLEYRKYLFSLGVLGNSYNGKLIQDEVLGLETSNDMYAAIRLSKMSSFENPICDYFINSSQEPHYFILNKNSQSMAEMDYSFYSYPFQNTFDSLTNDIDGLIEKATNQVAKEEKRKYNISGKVRNKLVAGEKITREMLDDNLAPQMVCVSESLDTVPWFLLLGAEMRIDLPPGQLIRFSDVEIENSLALGLWHEMLKNNFGRTYNLKNSKVDKKH